MITIIAKNEFFTGDRCGCSFAKGQSLVKELTERQYQWFSTHGYSVEGYVAPKKADKPKE